MNCGCPLNASCSCPATESATTVAVHPDPLFRPTSPSAEYLAPAPPKPLEPATTPEPIALPVEKVVPAPIEVRAPSTPRTEAPMLVVFANNMCLVDYNSVGASVTTDPVAIGDNNRATGTTTIHKLLNASGLSWSMQVSNDGVNWVTQGPSATGLAAEATTLQGPQTVTAVYARLLITFVSSGGNIGAAMFDIHVNFDRA